MGIVPDRFEFAVPPIPGESLVGFVARNSARYGLDRVATMLLPAGIETVSPECLPTVHGGHAPALAHIFKTSVEEIQARTYPEAVVPGRPNSFISFFGTPIRACYREIDRRRVSPISLRASDHYRAVWDIRVFSFCPESKERLIDRCPVCTKTLKWRWTLGVAWCEDCGNDIRDHPQPLIECGDMEALDFVADLVSPDAVRKAAARAKAPPTFGSLGPGEVFEFAVAIARVVANDFNTLYGATTRLRTSDDFARLTPDELALAGRAVLDWPKTYHAIADRVRGRADGRPGHWGENKELGPLMWLQRDPYLAPALKDVIRAAHRENMEAAGFAYRRAEQRVGDDLVTLRDVTKRYRIDPLVINRWRNDKLVWSMNDPTAKTSMVLLRREQMAAIAAMRDDRIGVTEASRLLGVHYAALDALADDGLIRRIARPAADLIRGAPFRRSSVEALRRSLLQRAAGAEPGVGMRLSLAARRTRMAPIPWSDIFRAILSDALPVHPDGSAGAVRLTGALRIDDALALRRIVAGAGARDLDDFVSIEVAAAILGTHQLMVRQFIDDPLPSDGAVPPKLDRAAVEEFRRIHIFTVEIAHRLGCRTRDVRRRLAEIGVRPCMNAHLTRFLVWDRAAVEPLLPRE